eukprot:3899077-Lingulodinium_polyedra.AAC.1
MPRACHVFHDKRSCARRQTPVVPFATGQGSVSPLPRQRCLSNGNRQGPNRDRRRLRLNCVRQRSYNEAGHVWTYRATLRVHNALCKRA